MNLTLMRAAAMCVLAPLIVSCGGSSARPYSPPKQGPTASLMLTSDAPNTSGEVYAGFYDNPSTECSGEIGYMGFVRYGVKFQTTKVHAIPAGRRIQVSPGYSAGGTFCMGFDTYSFQPEPGQTYRVRHEILTRTVPCTTGADGSPPPAACGTLLTEIEQRFCKHHVEVRSGADWSAAPDVKIFGFKSRCAAPPAPPAPEKKPAKKRR